MKNVKILHKRGLRAPIDNEIDVGEVAINSQDGALYVKTDGGDVVEIGSSADSTGAGMVISADEPADPVTGMQWLDVGGDEPYVWIFDEDKWVEFPAGKTSGGGGGDGKLVLPVITRSGEIQLPLLEMKLVVDTRSGPVELPLMAA
jgi:hypothetical protein